MESLRKAISRASVPVGLISTIGGFIGDIIAPLGNFAPWIAVLSAIAAALLAPGFVALRRKQGAEAWDSPVAGGLIIATASTAVFTFWAFIFQVGPDNGYLAENISPIATVQAQLLNLQEDVTEIKETTGETATQVVSAATAQAQGFSDIQSALAALQAGKGTLIENPVTPQDWYSNARLYQLRGDTVNAIKSYEGYFQFNLEFVDPYLDYVALLKASEGIARTRQAISAQLDAHPENKTLDMIMATLLDVPEDRLERLEALTTRVPQYGPAFNELAKEYTRALGKSFAAALLAKQQAAFAQLFKLEEQQLFSQYYIDKKAAEEQLEAARSIVAGYAGSAARYGKVDIQIYNLPDGTRFNLSITDAVPQQILFNFDHPEPVTDTGRIASGGQTFPNYSVGPLTLPLGEHTFYMRYIDANGTPSQVFSKTFQILPIALTFFQMPIDFSTNTIPGNFSVGVLGAVESDVYTYHYSVDSDALTETVESIAMTNILVTGLKPGEHTLYVQAIASDGKKTEVVKFPFTVN